MSDLPTSTYFDYENIRQVLDGVVYEVTVFGVRPRGIDWKYRRVPLSTPLIATQLFVDSDVVARYVKDRHAQTNSIQAVVPVLLEIDGRRYVLNGTHRLYAAMKRGDTSIECWVGTFAKPNKPP